MLTLVVRARYFLWTLTFACAEAGTGNLDPNRPDGAVDGGQSGDAGWGPDAGQTPSDGGPSNDGGPTFPETYRSGTRLRARLLEGGPGATAQIGWRDQDLGVDCAFTFAADGQLRCLPPGLVVREFADPGCTVPRVRSDSNPSITDRYYLRITEAPSLCSPARVDPNRLTEVFEAAGTEVTGDYYVGSPESCTLQRGLGFTLIVLRPVDPSSFVAGTVRLESVDPNLDRRAVIAEDGAYQALALRDRRRTRECTPHRPTLSCVGLDAVRTERDFRTADCAAELVVMSRPECGPAEVVLDLEPSPSDGCDLSTGRARLIGEEYQGALSRVVDGECRPVSSAPNDPLRTIAGLAPPDHFPAIQWVKEGEGAALLGRFRALTGEPLPSGRTPDFFVPGATRPCTVVRPIDAPDHVYCVDPDQAMVAQRYFRDPTCETPVARVAFFDTPTCQRSVTPNVLLFDRLSIPGLDGRSAVALQVTGPRYEGQVYTSAQDGSCQRVNLGGGARVELYELGPVVPWSEVVELREYVE